MTMDDKCPCCGKNVKALQAERDWEAIRERIEGEDEPC